MREGLCENLKNYAGMKILRERERERDRQTDKQRQTDRQTETDRQTNRDRQTDRKKVGSYWYTDSVSCQGTFKFSIVELG